MSILSRGGGVPADRIDLLRNIDGLPQALGRFTKELHDTSVIPERLSASSGWSGLRTRLEARVSDGLIEIGTLPSPYDRYSPERLLEIWVEGQPAIEELVLCLGNPELGNWLVSPEGVVGFGDVSALCLADRHLDLAIMQMSLRDTLGPETVFQFYEGYGQDPDLARLDHYVLAAILLGFR